MLVQGKNVVVYINVSGTWMPYICALGATIEYSTEFIETSVSGSGLWATFLPTKNAFTISMNGNVSLLDPASLTIAELRTMQFTQQLLLVKFERTDDAGNTYTEQCYAYISASSDTGMFDGVNTFSIEMQGTGAPTQQSTVPPPSLILRENGVDFIEREDASGLILRE